MTYDPAELLSYEVSSDGRVRTLGLPPPSEDGTMVPIYTQTAHSSERTLIGGQERRISVGETLKEAPTSQLSLRKAKWRPERGMGGNCFGAKIYPLLSSTFTPPQTCFLNYPNYMQTPGNWGFDFLVCFS